MGIKLGKSEFPRGSGPDDFQCFGPPATEDGQFDKVKIADLGCFDQSGKDSNKYYHGAVVQHKKTKKWYTYFEWGRTGATSPQFQFVECSSESDAQQEFADQLHDKNDKRGMWATIGGIKTLTAKPNKDCYLVRPMATRSTGLPDAKTIKLNEGSKAAVPAPTKGAPAAVVKKVSIDKYTMKLMKDLMGGTLSYTRGAMADSSLPTQKSIEEARQILQEAQKRLIKVGDDVDKQAADNELVQLTRVMYSRIPKKKALHCAAEDWILNKNNIMMWNADLDAFESALYVYDDTTVDDDNDPLQGIPVKMEWVDPSSALGKFLYAWWPKASANRHYGVGDMKIKNMWRIARNGDDEKLINEVKKVKTDLKNKNIKERPLFQPSERMDCQDRIKDYKESNTNLLLHGTRSVNVVGILRESFRLPKELVGVVITGSMFGPLLYMADDWRKSAGYTSLHGSCWSGGSGSVRGREAFMFACDVVCGNPFVAPGPKGYTTAPVGYHCIFGKGGYSQVQNNEWVIPNKNQVCIKYLCEFTT